MAGAIPNLRGSHGPEETVKAILELASFPVIGETAGCCFLRPRTAGRSWSLAGWCGVDDIKHPHHNDTERTKPRALRFRLFDRGVIPRRLGGHGRRCDRAPR